MVSYCQEAVRLDSEAEDAQNTINVENDLKALFVKNQSPLSKAMAWRRFLLWTGLGIFLYIALAVFYGTPALSASRAHKEMMVWPVTLLLWLSYYMGSQALQRYQETAPPSELVQVSTPQARVQLDIPLEAPKDRRLLPWITGLGLLVGIAAILIPPFHSTDIFGYINRGWQQLHYGLNPYVFTIAQIHGWAQDPMLTDHWVNNPSPYGFLYLLLAKGLCMLGGGDKTATVYVFKLSNLLIHFAIAELIWTGATLIHRRWGSIKHPELPLYLYLFNPLILIHSIANGHNDLWMGGFILLAAVCVLSEAWVWLIPSLIAATLFKYGAVVILPMALLLLVKKREWKALLWGCVIAFVLFIVSGFPYLGDWAAFHLKEIDRNAFVSHGSLHSFIYSIYKTIGKDWAPALYAQKEAIRSLLKDLFLGLYVIWYALRLLKRFRQPRYEAMEWIRDALLALTILICLVSLKFYPWYLGMFFPLALLLADNDWLRNFMLVLSCMQILSITFIGQAHLMNYALMTGVPILGFAMPRLGWRWPQIAVVSISIVVGLLSLALAGGFVASRFSPVTETTTLTLPATSTSPLPSTQTIPKALLQPPASVISGNSKDSENRDD